LKEEAGAGELWQLPGILIPSAKFTTTDALDAVAAAADVTRRS
jgi:hypothetical protein